MAAKIAVLFAVCFAIASGAMVRRDAPQTQTNYLEEISKHADQFGKTFSEQFTNLASAKNTEELNTALKTNTDVLLAKVSEFSTALGKAFEDTNGKTKAAFAETAQRLEQTVAELRRNSNVDQQAKELGDKIKSAVQNTVQETDKLAKQISANTQEIGNKLTPAFKQAYDDFVKHAEDVQKKVHEAANKA